MYGFVILLALSAPVPPEKPLPDFKPGRYMVKWGTSPFHEGIFTPDGFFAYKYNDRWYHGYWFWDKKRRILQMPETCTLPLTEYSNLSQYNFQFGRKLDEGKTPGGTVILLRPIP